MNTKFISLTECESFTKLKENYTNLKSQHLKDLLKDESRNQELRLICDTLFFDFSHEKIDHNTLENLFNLAEERKL